jgi:hypothetical protein
MTGTLRVRRSRGALSGVLLVLLGLWGGLIPLVGPYFHYAYKPDNAWHYTTGRLWLELLPGLAVVIGGIIVLISRFRPSAVLGGWLAAAGGAWFAVGTLVAAHWTSLPSAGTPVGGSARMVLEQIGFFTGLGVLIAFIAGIAIGRVTVVAHRDVTAAAADAPVTRPADTEPEPASKSASQPDSQPRPLRRLTLPRPLVRSGAGSGSSDSDADSDDD